jgi:hypothetical protein
MLPGVWQGAWGQFVIRDNGRIQLQRQLGGPSENGAPSRPAVRTPITLSGRYTVSGDLVFVLWEDGRRQNFRWILLGQKLRMLDHEQRYIELTRIGDAVRPPAHTAQRRDRGWRRWVRGRLF